MDVLFAFLGSKIKLAGLAKNSDGVVAAANEVFDGNESEKGVVSIIVTFSAPSLFVRSKDVGDLGGHLLERGVLVRLHVRTGDVVLGLELFEDIERVEKLGVDLSWGEVARANDEDFGRNVSG